MLPRYPGGEPMRRLILLLFTAFATSCGLLQPAAAEKRVALVIGNSAYQNAPKLPNPTSDAAAIGEMFRSVKFDVVEARRDLNIAEMRRAFRDFSDKARDADIAVVYYAGHGLEVGGINYLIPIDAALERDSDAFDEAIPLDRALQVVEPARQLRLVILDACRDNPFARTMKRTMGSRGLGRGLAGVEPDRPNTLIAFAAKGGSTADDGTGAHSPFTTALLNHLVAPGVDLRKALGQVRDEVMKATGDRQEPFVYGSLGGADVSLVPAQPAPATAGSGAASDPQDRIRRDYELATQLGTRDGWETIPAAISVRLLCRSGQRAAQQDCRRTSARRCGREGTAGRGREGPPFGRPSHRRNADQSLRGCQGGRSGPARREEADARATGQTGQAYADEAAHAALEKARLAAEAKYAAES